MIASTRRCCGRLTSQHWEKHTGVRPSPASTSRDWGTHLLSALSRCFTSTVAVWLIRDGRSVGRGNERAGQSPVHTALSYDNSAVQVRHTACANPSESHVLQCIETIVKQSTQPLENSAMRWLMCRWNLSDRQRLANQHAHIRHVALSVNRWFYPTFYHHFLSVNSHRRSKLIVHKWEKKTWLCYFQKLGRCHFYR